MERLLLAVLRRFQQTNARGNIRWLSARCKRNMLLRTAAALFCADATVYMLIIGCDYG